ncbi:MAG: exo-alpha-sialidase [Chloroflexi bacterium]|nr:exo-alpha-sialidase [Chloroflexota bacterium]
MEDGMSLQSRHPTVALALLPVLAFRAPQAVHPAPTNVRVSHGHYQAYGEPYLATNPRNPRNLLGAAQCINGSVLPLPCTFVSFDGGASWQENGPLPLPGGDKGGGDVTVGFNAQGMGLIASHAGTGWNVDTVVVWRTQNGGRSFSRPVVVFPGSRGSNVVDHPSLAVDTASAHQPGTIYLAWTTNYGQGFSSRTRLLFSRSIDDGRSFTRPHIIAQVEHGFPGIPVVTAGPAGTVHVVYAVGYRDPYASPFVPLMRLVVSSSDGGQHFGPPRPIAAEPGFGITFDHMKMANIAAAATDARDGTAYVAMVAYRSTSHHTDVLLWHSRDGGESWTTPVRVNSDSVSDRVDHVQPQLVVTPHGTVYVSYFAVAHGRVDVYLTYSTTHGASLAPSRRITSASFDPRLSGQEREGSPWIGDYQGLAAAAGWIHLLWNDTRTGHMELYTAAVPQT